MFAASVIAALFWMVRASSASSTVGVGVADTQVANRAAAADVNLMMGRRSEENKIWIWVKE